MLLRYCWQDPVKQGSFATCLSIIVTEARSRRSRWRMLDREGVRSWLHNQASSRGRDHGCPRVIGGLLRSGSRVLKRSWWSHIPSHSARHHLFGKLIDTDTIQCYFVQVTSSVKQQPWYSKKINWSWKRNSITVKYSTALQWKSVTSSVLESKIPRLLIVDHYCCWYYLQLHH